MKRKHRLVLFSILSLLILCFIFGNSLQGGEASNAVSSGVAQLLQPLLDPSEKLSEDAFHILIRKLAHFTEFAALGFCLFGVAYNIPLSGKRGYLMPTLLPFTAACADETIQHFTGRTCALKDVCIDTAGALFGIAFAAAVVWAWKRRK